MNRFSYIAKTPDNTSITGIVEALTVKEALQMLRKKNLFIIDIEEKKQHIFEQFLSSRTKRVKFNDIVTFTRQFSTMITAGLMIPDALIILEQQTTNTALQVMLHDISQHVTTGSSLTEAFLRHKQAFSPIYISLIRAGELSGSLDKVLERLSDTLESQKEFRGKIVGAMIYPIIILFGMCGVIIVMMTVVIPKLSSLYKDFNMELPLSTKILIAVSEFLIGPGGILSAVGLVIGTLFFLRWRKTLSGRRIVDSLILKIPVIGPLLTKIMLVEFTRTMSMLSSSGIHVLDSIKMLRSSLGNIQFEEALLVISRKVERGFSLADSFSSHVIFPPIVSQMIRVGEETGKLDDTLFKLSKYFQSESEHLVRGLTTAIEPIIMVFLGVGVGFIVISVITPIYNLTSNFR
jgi:type IV pilus assembly protein PilC